jgi:hypothetical protein
MYSLAVGPPSYMTHINTSKPIPEKLLLSELWIDGAQLVSKEELALFLKDLFSRLYLPCEVFIPMLDERVKTIYPNDDLTHYTWYTWSEINDLFGDAGFVYVMREDIIPNHSYICSALTGDDNAAVS